MSKHGFNLEELPGNMVVVLAKLGKDDLVSSGLCPSDYSINDDQDAWLVISPTQSYDPEFLSNLAGEISSKLNCETIKYEYFDGSGHNEFVLYNEGDIKVRYSYGEYDEEMAEYMGEREPKPHEVIVQEGEFEYIYFSEEKHPEKSEIECGSAFLNKLFEDLGASLSWDYLPS
jgi:hypothetical protein